MSRILLVADDIAEISAVKRVLLRGGHQAILATNTADAAAAVSHSPPHAAIISSTCEGSGGLALAHRLGAEAATAHLPVLVLGESPDAPPRAVQLARPIDPARLAEELQRALEVTSPTRGARGQVELSAIGPGSAARVRPPGRDAERKAAADALLQRAGELRRAKVEDTAFPWENAAPAAGAGGSAAATRPPPQATDAGQDARARDFEAQIDEELARLTMDDEVAPAAPAPPAGLESDWLRAQEQATEEALHRAEEEIRQRAEAEEAGRRLAAARERAQEEGARRRAEAEEEAARMAEAEARLALAERAAARAAAEEAARRRALQLADELKARAAPPEPLAPLPPLSPPRPAEPAAAPAPEPELPPPPPELAHGSLAEAPLPRLLALAERARLTGRLDFGGDVPRSLYFEDGKVVGATSAAPHERVEEVALRLGLVTREQHRQAAPALAGLPSRRAALALLDRGFLKPAELTPLVRRRTEEILFALFAEEKALFTYEAARVPPEERIALERGPSRLAMEGVRRKWLEPRLDAVLGGPATLLSPAHRAAPPAGLGLGPSEQRVLELADGLRTLDEILDSSPLPPLETRQVLAGLLMVGVLTLRFHGSVESRTESQAIDLARVREKVEQVRRADYFAILGLSRHCTPYEIREAAGRLTAEFDPGRYAGHRDAALRSQLDEVLRVVAEAREILCDDALRAEYLSGLGE